VANYTGYIIFAQNTPIIEINLNKALNASAKEIMLSTIASDIQYIPLETTDNSLLSKSYDVRYMGDEILAGSEGNFYHFDKNGKFMNVIGQKGNGPGEYNYGMFYFLDNDRKYMYIYEFNYMLCYTYDGRFVRKLQAPDLNMGTAEIFNENHIIYSNDTYFSNTANPLQLFVMDTIGKSIGKIRGHIEKNKRYGVNPTTRDFMYIYDRAVYFKPALENVVYKVISPKNKELAIRFDVGSKDVEVDRNEIRPEDRMKSISVFQIHETDKYIFVLYGYENKFYNGLYDKKTKIFSNVIIKDDLSGGMDIIPAGKCDSRYMCMVYFPEKIREARHYSIASLPERKKEFGQLLSKLKEDDNPILILMTLR
jgi:hypothetical protein